MISDVKKAPKNIAGYDSAAIFDHSEYNYETNNLRYYRHSQTGPDLVCEFDPESLFYFHKRADK